MAEKLGSSPGSGFAAQVLEPSFAEHLQSMSVELPYQQLQPVNATLEALALEGWQNPRALTSADFESMYGRRIHSGFLLVMADSKMR